MDDEERLHHHFETWRDRERYAPHTRTEDVLCRLRVPIARITGFSAPFTRGCDIAAAFEAADNAPGDVIVRTAFAELKSQVNYWWKVLHENCGVTVTATDDLDPYPSAAEQARDMRFGRLITSTKLAPNHPLMSEEDYWRFRAVHDAFGHAAIGRGFDRHGEYQAWLIHGRMFSGYGAWAMSSEYRGINSSLCFGQRVPAGSKAVLLPASLVLELDHPEFEVWS